MTALHNVLLSPVKPLIMTNRFLINLRQITDPTVSNQTVVTPDISFARSSSGGNFLGNIGASLDVGNEESRNMVDQCEEEQNGRDIS